MLGTSGKWLRTRYLRREDLVRRVESHGDDIRVRDAVKVSQGGPNLPRWPSAVMESTLDKVRINGNGRLIRLRRQWPIYSLFTQTHTCSKVPSLMQERMMRAGSEKPRPSDGATGPVERVLTAACSREYGSKRVAP